MTTHDRFVVVLIGSTTLYAFLLRSLQPLLAPRVDSTWISAGILVGCLLLYGPLILCSGLPRASHGLSMRHWRRHATEALAWSAAFLAAITALKSVLLQVVPGWSSEPLFSMYGFTRYDSPGQALTLMAVYGSLVPAQELVARGALQTSLERMLAGPRRSVWAIVLSTAIFSQIHLHMSVTYALSVAVPSLLWGALYARQRSLVGVSVSHATIGVYVAFFLGFPTLQHGVG